MGSKFKLGDNLAILIPILWLLCMMAFFVLPIWAAVHFIVKFW